MCRIPPSKRCNVLLTTAQVKVLDRQWLEWLRARRARRKGMRANR